MSYDAPGSRCYRGKDIEDLTKEKESLNSAKKRLLEEIPFFSGLPVESDLSLFRSNLVSKFQEDLSNISRKKCKLKETARFILKYNEIVREFVNPTISWEYTILPFFKR